MGYTPVYDRCKSDAAKRRSRMHRWQRWLSGPISRYCWFKYPNASSIQESFPHWESLSILGKMRHHWEHPDNLLTYHGKNILLLPVAFLLATFVIFPFAAIEWLLNAVEIPECDGRNRLIALLGAVTLVLLYCLYYFVAIEVLWWYAINVYPKSLNGCMRTFWCDLFLIVK